MNVQKADQMPYVTRDLFYFCVGQIWVVIALVLSKLTDNGSFTTYFLFGVATVLSVTFGVLGIWEMKCRRAAESKRGES